MLWTQRHAVGVLGLGIIGSRVAAVLRAKGFRVYVWNRSPKPEPNFLGSPAEVAGAARTIQVFVSDEAALDATIKLLTPGIGRGHTVLLHPTVDPATVRRAASAIQATGAAVLEAPFTGSRIAAENAQLVYYIGGDTETLDRARPILEASSKSIVELGGLGDAAVFKIATNLITASTVQALGEAVALVRAAGLDPSLLPSALAQNAARSGAVDLKLPAILANDFPPHFSLRNMAKDMRLAEALASGADLPLLRAVRAGLDAGVADGWGEEDFSVLARRLAPKTDPKPAASEDSASA